eukprot:TRINITY_DN31553_c0_g1_i1.p1 TRINITY_DN31553_c0_g1~~TRINITY_DN31553_c0_g1_i1.p1  ORF type:complete len:403 (-),score=105.30 TRINITY_DN31553_c0_g1_i1:98-1306(-)
MASAAMEGALVPLSVDVAPIAVQDARRLVDFAEPKRFYVLSDKRPLGILAEPEATCSPSSYLRPLEAFEVKRVLLDSSDQRRYFELADGSGWVAECSRKDPSRLVIKEIVGPIDLKLGKSGPAEAASGSSRSQQLSPVREQQHRKKAGASKAKPRRPLLADVRPRIPRARRRRIPTGAAAGVVVSAAYHRSSGSLRGYGVQGSFQLPGGQLFRGGGAKSRFLDAAPKMAPQTFMLYSRMQKELDQEWKRLNVWSEKDGRWISRPKFLKLTDTESKPALANEASKRGRKQKLPASRALALARCEDADAGAAAAGSSCRRTEPKRRREETETAQQAADAPLPLENGPLAIEDGQLALSDVASTGSPKKFSCKRAQPDSAAADRARDWLKQLIEKANAAKKEERK